MQLSNSQRLQPESAHRIRVGKLHPRRHLCATSGTHQPHTGRQSPCSKGHNIRTGGIHPLHIIDSHQHRTPGPGGQPVQHRHKRRRHRTSIAMGWLVAPTQQRRVQTLLLGGGQIRPDRIIDFTEQIGQRRIGQHRLSRSRPAGQHHEPPLTSPAQHIKPQCRLTDTRIALDHQRRGRTSHSIQKFDDGLLLSPPTYHPHRHPAVRHPSAEIVYTRSLRRRARMPIWGDRPSIRSSLW